MAEPRLSDDSFAKLVFALWFEELPSLGEGHPFAVFLHEVKKEIIDPYLVGDLMPAAVEFLSEYVSARAAEIQELNPDPVAMRRWATGKLTQHFIEQLLNQSVSAESMAAVGVKRQSN